LKHLSILTRASLAGALALLAGAYALMGGWAFAGAVVAVGALWAFGMRRRAMALVSVGLAGLTLLAAFGLAQGLSAAPVLLAGVLALAAWDMARLLHRLGSVEHIENRDVLIRQHLTQLAGVCVAGLLIALAASIIRLNLSFAAVFALGLLALWALSRLSRKRLPH
jgi:hypothetical protein